MTMKNPPLVSVCIPAYNAESTIGDTIRSLLDQTYENFEVVVVNDCSNDNTEKVVKEFSDPRIRFINNDRNLGINANWQKTILEARGRYVILLGHDDMLMPYCLERLVDVFERHEHVGMVGFRAQMLPQKTTSWRPVYGEITPSALKDSIIEFTNITPPSEIMYRTSAVKEVRGYDRGYNYSPEVTLAMKLALNNWHTINLDEILGVRTTYPDRVTAVVSPMVRLKDKLKFIKDYHNHYSLKTILAALGSVSLDTIRMYKRKIRRSIKR
jgi:glycosyltransferase involved in cell wall biosynthesis